MKYSLKITWMLILFCGSLLNLLKAQEPVMETTIVQPPNVDSDVYEPAQEEDITLADTLLIASPWSFSSDSIRRIRNQKDFAYLKNLDSLLKIYQEELLKQEEEAEAAGKKETGNYGSAIRLLLWTIAIAVVLFLIYRLFLSERGLFAAPLKNKTIQVEEEPVTDEAWLDQQLKEASRAGNHRLAIRYLYLLTLSKLAAKGWLTLSPDKTNYQYINELNKYGFKNEFARVTLLYEYAWYGDFTIGEELFAAVKKEYDQFHQKVKLG